MITISDYDEHDHQNDDSLEEIHLDGTEDFVKYRCFYGCRNLRIVRATNTITKIYTSAFDNCDALEELHFPGVHTFDRAIYNGEYYNIIRPSYWNGVFKIRVFDFPKLTSNISGSRSYYYYDSYRNNGFFARCPDLETVNIQSYEEAESFYNCSKLVSVNVQSARALGTFENCESLGSLEANQAESITSFAGCTLLTRLSLNSLKSIPEYAFSNCSSLEEFDFNPVEQIGDYAFANCINLKRLQNLNSINVGRKAFLNCNSITSVVFHEGNGNNGTQIGYGAFATCENLEEIHLTGVTEIREESFANLTALKRTIDCNAQIIHARAFINCENIDSINLAKTIYIGEDAFKGCSKLLKVDLSSARNIGKTAFLSTSISGILTIGTNENDNDNDEQIGLIDNEAFKNLDLSSVTIGKNIEVNQYAFYNTKLENLSLNTGCIIHSNAFRNVITLRIVYLTDCKVDTNAFFLCMNINSLHINGRLLELQSGCFDSIKACVYYYGVDDYYLDTTIIVINRVYTAVFVKHNYNHKTFCVIPVTKGFNNPCPRERASNAFIIAAPENNVLNQKSISEPTCQECVSNSRAAYLLAFFIQTQE